MTGTDVASNAGDEIAIDVTFCAYISHQPAAVDGDFPATPFYT